MGPITPLQEGVKLTLDWWIENVDKNTLKFVKWVCHFFVMPMFL